MIAPVADASIDVEDLPWVDLVPPMSELELNPVQTDYVEKTISIPAAFAGQQVRIAFIMIGDEKDRWLIDNVESFSLCSPPSYLTATDITTTSAKLNWFSPTGVTAWEIEVLPAANTPTGTGQSYSGTLPYQVNSLTIGTEYKYYVRSACADGGKSVWVGPFFFNTNKIGDKCGAPIVIPTASLPYTTTNNTAGFGDFYDGIPGTGCGTTAAYLNGNDVVYSYTPTFSGNININLSNTQALAGVFVYTSCANIGLNCAAGALATATASAVITPFAVTAGTTYYIVVSSPATTVPYTLTLQQVSCAAPTGLAASGHTPTSVNLTWAAGTATSWQIFVQPLDAGFPTVAGQNVTQNTNLTVSSTSAGVPFAQASNYEYYVRANCGDGTYSIWSGPFAISTTQVPVTLDYTQNFEGPAVHGWSLNNGTQPNKWYVGSVTANNSVNSLYISNNGGTNNEYVIGVASSVYAYRDIIIPAGTNQIGLSFDLKMGGETNDYVRAWLVPVSFVPAPGTPLTTANSGGLQIGGNFNLAADWTTKTEVLNVAAVAGTTRRLVFEWRNNTSAGLMPAAAIDNINVAIVTCSPPTALTLASATPTSATFTWTAPAATAPTGYDYYYSLSPVAPTATTPVSGSVIATTTATISPLNETETYYMWVRSSCGAAGKSFWTGPVSVLVPQTANAIPYTQNFDGAASLLTYQNGTQPNKWVVGTATSNSATKSLYISADNGTSNAYDPGGSSIVQVYKDITIPATATEINVTFDYKSVGEATDYFRVWMVPTTYVIPQGSQIGAAAGNVMLGANHFNTPNWTTVSYDTPVTAYQNQKRRLVFEWRNNAVGGAQTPAAIDNINIALVTCTKPTTLAAINVTNTNATLDWTEAGTATSWEVAFMPAANAATPTTPGTPVTTTSEYTPPVGTFVYGTQYVFYVRSNCGGANGMSNWSGPFLFALKPANDNCAQATVVPTNTNTICTNFVTGNVTGATASGEASACTGTKDDDVWYEFVATSTIHTITLSNIVGDDFDLYHALYSGNNCATMTPVYCSTLLTSIASNLVIGQTYKLRVYTGTATPNQTTRFQLCVTTPAPSPANDNCATATALTINPSLLCSVTTQATVESATPSGGPNTCSGSADDDVWFSFVATNGTHKIDLVQIENGVSMNFALYSGTCGTLTQMACNANGQTGYWANNLTIGTTYYLRVYTFASLPGLTTKFEVCIGTPPPPPANDECATATVVTVNPTLDCVDYAHGNIVSATASTQLPTCSDANDNDDIWFQFTATSTAHIIEFKNFEGKPFGIVSDFTNLDHAVYAGAGCASLTQVGTCASTANNNSLVTGLTIGQVYKIRVWSATPTGNQQCEFDVCITTPPVITNDECATAITIPVNNDSYCNVHASGSVFGATATPLANTCTGTPDDDVWFTFTATSASHLIYLDNIKGTSASLYHSVYSGDCAVLNLLYCSTTVGSGYNSFIVGNTYKVRVYTSVVGNQSTSFDICVRVPNAPIDVDDNAYTNEELVKEVLFNTPCATVSNVTSISG
jgi:hypothetical protein